MHLVVRWLFICCFLCGCDVPGFLVVENARNEEVTFLICYQEEGEEQNTVMQTILPKKETEIIYGFGHNWSDRRLKEYVSTIDKIEIYSRRDTQRISDTIELYDFFKKGKTTNFKRHLRVVVE